ncbi:MAG: HDOD domain-containing protein [candidate division Zixibacteria bacterium]
MTVTIRRELREKLEKFSNLPSMPQIIARIQQISGDPKASVADLSNAILSDHQLTSRILRMANSTYYGEYSGKVSTVTHAIVLMGFRAVRNIAVTMSIYGSLNKLSKKSSFDITSFWTRSLACGLVAKTLAHRVGQSDLVETAFIAGFLHDIGQIILAGVFPEGYSKMSLEQIEAPEVNKTEQTIIGIDHLEVGSFVALKWNLPPLLVAAIAEHHRQGMGNNEKSDNQLIDLVYIADRVYPHLVNGCEPSDRSYQGVIDSAIKLLGVSVSDMESLLESCREQMSDVASDLDINIARQFEARSVPEEGIEDLQQRLSNKEVQLAFLQNISTALMEAKTEDEILQVICETVYRGLRMGRVIIFSHHSDGDCFRGAVGFGVESQQSVKTLKFSAKVGLFKNMMETGEVLSVVGPSCEIYGSLLTDGDTADLEAEAFVAVPMKVLDKVQFTLFADYQDKARPMDDENLRSLISLTNQASLVLERNHLRKRTGR